MLKKLLTGAVAFAVVAGLFGSFASANAATMTSTASATLTTFSQNLTVGSRSADVSSLQAILIAGGYLTAVSTPTGYFGSATKAALAKWQAAVGITPASGYFGPISRAKLNSTSTTTTTGALCPNGMTLASNCSSAATSATGITTTGVEGTITLTSSNAGIASTIYEGSSKVAVLGLKLEAKSSDISVQRVKLDLGTSTSIYNKVLSKIYVMDGSTVVASSDLNSNTVVKDGSVYYITLAGFNALVKKDTSKVLTVAVDVMNSIDSTDRSVSRTVRVAASGVRGLDGAGLDQYTSNVVTDVTKSFTISNTLSDSATLKTSLNTASPKAGTIIASAGSNQDEADKVSALVFNVKAEKDNMNITDITVSATGTSVAAGNITTAYLYDGSTEIDNASVNTTTGLATFNDIDVAVSKDTTKVLTVKVDVRTASTTALALTVSTVSVVGENTVGDAFTATGSATGEAMQVQKAGAVITLVGTPTLTKSVIGNTASSTFLTSFNFKVKAEGQDLTVASTSAFVVGIYVNNARVATTSAVYFKPTSGVTQTGSGPFTIADGSEATFTAEYGFVGPAGLYTPAGAIVNARLESVTTSAGTVTYVSDTFRTNSSTL